MLSINKLPVNSYDIVVFSHLRWDFVWQRPQHLMQRFSKHHRVLFIEEPLLELSHNRLRQISDTLFVLQSPNMGNEAVESILNELKIMNPVVWTYSPSFIDQIERMSYRLLVYDCMDELSAFKGASTFLKKQEFALLHLADLVFTGGKSLYEAKIKRHHSVYCFPSSVDTKHFEETPASAAVPDDIGTIKDPIVGFYGVLDERLDVSLLGQLASIMPQVNFVLIGPVVKIFPSDLPQLPNIHYLGMKTYQELPAYLHRFDVAFMPFALNDSTRFISPTKTLEFMAAHKPIVSTPIRDVVSDYKKLVKIADSATAMKNSILEYLYETKAASQIRHKMEIQVLSQTSWDNTVKRMWRLIEVQLSEKRTKTRVSNITNEAELLKNAL